MTLRVGIVGGGVLGMVLAYRLSKLGHEVEVFEVGQTTGGLATWHDYGPFVWDRFYHCILPTDSNLVGLIEELGLGSELVWHPTKTGYYGRGQCYSMSSTADYARFPLLSWIDKARIGTTVAYAALAADPMSLYSVTAQDWLIRWCGRHGYDVFWRPLLKAKFGSYYDQVAAVFIWATITRLFGARGAASKEKLGYVRGGYRTILGRLEAKLAEAKAVVHTGTKVTSLREEPDSSSATPTCVLSYDHDGLVGHSTFDQVFFTGPTKVARPIVSTSLLPIVEQMERDHPTGLAYLGVACLVLGLKRSLTPFYILNVGDESIEMTGIIEMTNLIDRRTQTQGQSLVYVPKYMDSDDPALQADDATITAALLDRGVRRIVPDLKPSDITYAAVHRARFVQPLPLVHRGVESASATSRAAPRTGLRSPLHILNTSMLRCATLNNDEVVGFVDGFVAETPELGPVRAPAGSAVAGRSARERRTEAAIPEVR